MEELKKQVEEKINLIVEQGIQEETVEVLGDLVDIHKDISNEEYWKKKEEAMEMNYRGYGNYSTYGNEYGRDEYGRRARDSRGRYTARGGRGRYRGEEPLEEMKEMYMNYSEGREQYGHDMSTMKSLDMMLQSVVDFMEMLKKDAGSQEEMDLIKKYSREISEM